jgi:hypothetical protein
MTPGGVFSMKMWHDDTLTLPLPKAASVRSKMTLAHIRPRAHDGFTVEKGRRFAQTQIAVRSGVENHEVIQGHLFDLHRISEREVSKFTKVFARHAHVSTREVLTRLDIFAPVMGETIAYIQFTKQNFTHVVPPITDLTIHPLSGGVNGR